MINKKGLGKGLGALLVPEIEDFSGVKHLKISQIEPNTKQPRKRFNDDKLKELSESIKIHGVVQPIIVRKDGDIFRIIAGERRWRAARIAGLNEIPALVKELSSKEELEIALIENIQREDLNPIEEAETFNRLLKEHSLTQEELSKSVGKSRSAIANTVRLLALSEKVKKYLINMDITSGHARALLSIDDHDKQEILANEIIKKKLNVRETEILVNKLLKNNQGTKRKKEDNPLKLEVEEKLRYALGTKVKLFASKKKGKIVIEYYSNDELDRIMGLVCGTT